MSNCASFLLFCFCSVFLTYVVLYLGVVSFKLIVRHNNKYTISTSMSCTCKSFSIILYVNRCIRNKARFYRSRIWHVHNVSYDTGTSEQKATQHLATCFRYTALRNTNFCFFVALCSCILRLFLHLALKELSTVRFDSCLFVTRMFFKTCRRFGTKGSYVNERSIYSYSNRFA